MMDRISGSAPRETTRARQNMARVLDISSEYMKLGNIKQGEGISIALEQQNVYMGEVARTCLTNHLARVTGARVEIYSERTDKVNRIEFLDKSADDIVSSLSDMDVRSASLAARPGGGRSLP